MQRTRNVFTKFTNVKLYGTSNCAWNSKYFFPHLSPNKAQNSIQQIRYKPTRRFVLITGRFIQGKHLQRQLPAHQPLFKRITDAAIIVFGSMVHKA